MPQKKTKNNACPSCGEPVSEPYKTWELVAPFPDKKMRITVTVLGMFKCPSCGKTFKGTVSKLKLGADDIDTSS